MKLGEVREDFELWYSEKEDSPKVGGVLYLCCLDSSSYFITNKVCYYKIKVMEILKEKRRLNKLGNEVVFILFKGKVEDIE